MTYNVEAAHKVLLNKTPSYKALRAARAKFMSAFMAAVEGTQVHVGRVQDFALNEIVAYTVNLCGQFHHLTWGDARDECGGKDWYTLYRQGPDMTGKKTPLITFDYLETEGLFVLPGGQDPLVALVDKLFQRADLSN